MNLSELWKLYRADKRILGFTPYTLKAYSLQLKVLIREIGDLELDDVSLSVLKEYLAIQSERLKPSSLGHRIRFIRSLFRYAFCDGANPICRMTIPTLRYAVKLIAARGRIPVNVYPHRFRHTYACQLLENGAPLDFIQGMLGHEKASTTQILCSVTWRAQKRTL